MSQNRRGENNSFFGKNHTEETKALLSEIAKNRTKSNKPVILVEVYDLETKKLLLTDHCELLRKVWGLF